MDLNEQAERINDQAQYIAQKAGAIERCRFHPCVTINKGDPEATKRAYAIATNRWKASGMLCDREEFMEAIKDAIESSAHDECPECTRLRDD